MKPLCCFVWFIQEQLELEYGDLGESSYCHQLLGVCKQVIREQQPPRTAGLVLGSGTGLMSFMLTQLFHKVIIELSLNVRVTSIFMPSQSPSEVTEAH